MKPDIISTVTCITVCCYLIGIAVKVTGKMDKWIPVIVGAVGAALGVVGMYTIKEFPAHDILNAIAIGIASGLASTGVNQITKQLSQVSEPDPDAEFIYPDEIDDDEDE